MLSTAGFADPKWWVQSKIYGFKVLVERIGFILKTSQGHFGWVGEPRVVKIKAPYTEKQSL